MHDGLGAAQDAFLRDAKSEKGERDEGVGVRPVPSPSHSLFLPVLLVPTSPPLPLVPSASPLHTSPLSACKISLLAADWSLLRQSAVGAKLLRVAAQIDAVLGGESIKQFVVGSDTMLEHA